MKTNQSPAAPAVKTPAASVNLRECGYTRALVLKPLDARGNMLHPGGGIAIYKRTQLGGALESFAKQCEISETLKAEIRGSREFGRLPV